MKKLLYINAIHHGGAERVMVNLANKFVDCGDDVVLVTSFEDEWEYPYDERVKRITLGQGKIEGFVKRNLTLTKSLRRVIKAEKPDIVISFMAEPNYRAILATRFIKTKLLISVRNDPNREYPSKLHRFLAKKIYSKADGVVFQTEDARAWFPSKIQKKSRIIMNQIDDKFFSVKYDGDRKNIVATGRLTKQKNHKLLIDAFSLICDKVDENLIIYGEGELREELEKYIEEKELTTRVLLPGAVKDVPAAIKSAKLYVLSSDFEGMPNALIEAMAIGIPCVSTDCPCGGPKVMLGDATRNLLTPISDAGAMANKIMEILRLEPDALNDVGKEMARLAQKCKGDIVIKEWDSYTNDICKGK